ncbi:RNA-directed DNA polymerase, eukaryota [Tanacetum coccineum]
MGIGVSHEDVNAAANIIRCSTFSTPFNYLGIKVGMSSSRSKSLDEMLDKISSRLLKWKIKTLSIGGRLTLIKSVLTSLPLYHISIYKAPMGVLHNMKSFRRRFFNGVDKNEKNISMIRAPHGGMEEEQYLQLVNLVAFVTFSNSNDRWVWLHDSSGAYSVNLARSYIDDSLLPTVGSPTRWVKVVPIKINIFAWKVCLDNLPMRLNLSLRGIDIPFIICPICSSAGESCSHLLFSCIMARLLLLKVARWWDLDIPKFLSYEDWLAWLNSIRLAKGFKDVLEGVFYVMWWVIWKFRNQVLFGSSQPRMDLLFDEIVLLSFAWCSNRCKNNFDSISWLKYPRSLSL